MINRQILLSFLVFSLLDITSSANQDSSTSKAGYRIFERHEAPDSLIRLQIPSDHQHELTLRIGLKQAGVKTIQQKLHNISNPSSPFYGKHLNAKEVLQLKSPTEMAVSSVMNWLLGLGVEERKIKWSTARDWVKVAGLPLTKVESMLDTKYFYFKDSEGQVLVRTEQYGLPHHLHDHVDLVQPTTLFGRLRKESSNIAIIEPMPIPAGDSAISGSKCQTPFAVSNRCLQELYHTSDYRFSSSRKTKLGITGYLGELAGYDDLKNFMSRERPNQSNFNYSVEAVNGGSNSQTIPEENYKKRLGVEANLDLQTAMGFTSPGIENVFYSVGGSPPFKPATGYLANTNEPYLEWVEYISNQADSALPKVISTSYGDYEQTVPESYAKRVCNEFAALGSRGVSLIFASGDDGVGKDGTCSDNGKNTVRFQPSFPATCPYVTSVGATEGFHPEVAVSPTGAGGFASGGGFSEYFSRPDYQTSDVDKYLQLLNGKFQGSFSPKGRAYPDVSAQGAKYIVSYQKKFLLVGGTSASTPTFASIIALLNDHNLSQGKSTMGFLNPWLYDTAKNSFNDVTGGSAAGCNSSGFPAAVGWDPVTGLGTPHFKKLLELSSSAGSKPTASDVDDEIYEFKNSKHENLKSISKSSSNPSKKIRKKKSSKGRQKKLPK